ncbi:gp2 [Aeromonas phage 65]|uniref:Gp2 n=1 Tax=Aeromonas phage 65 TaxID=2919549 RepID=E5DRV0_9CAUD|nr:DNA end protector [Aeromonas phage 65]ADQ53124.1 gp2 [Aeromonas phage 65]
MIFELNEREETPAEKRRKRDWIGIGSDYMATRKKSGITAKKYAEEKGLNYETFSRAMRRHREDIKKYYSLTNPNKTKEQWIELGVDYLTKKEKSNITQKEYIERSELNKETAERAFRRFKDDIIIAKRVKDAKYSNKKLTSGEKYQVLLQDFRGKVRQFEKEPQKSERKSIEWFSGFIKKNVRGHKVTRPVAGRLYTFAYDAKHKATLPYWDKFPLIVYLGESRKHKGMLMGLNLHYIPVKARKEFMEELLKYATTDRITNRTSLNINWGKVRGMKGADHMIKAYLPNHVRGPFMEVKPQDWSSVINLPTQRFVTGPESKTFNTNKVWSSY